MEITSVPYATYAHQTPWAGVLNVPLGFADNIDDDTLSGLTCNNGEIIEWSGSAWVYGVDNIGSNGSAGDITGVQAGIGLTGGGVQGDVILDVDFAGPGAANTAARSDHNHDTRYYTETELSLDRGAQVHWNNLVQVPTDVADGDDDTLAGLVCTDSQIVKRQGTAWVCAADEIGGASPVGWSLTGNAGTIPGQDFIGTVDN